MSGKFREYLLKKIEIAEKTEQPTQVEVTEEIIEEKADLSRNPVEVLREFGYIIKTELPSKRGVELSFFKETHAENALDYLVKLGYNDIYKIVQVKNILAIEK